MLIMFILIYLLKRKDLLSEKAIAKLSKVDHSWQGKKKVGLINSTIDAFFGDGAQQKSFEDLVFYICKSYRHFSIVFNTWKYMAM